MYMALRISFSATIFFQLGTMASLATMSTVPGAIWHGQEISMTWNERFRFPWWSDYAGFTPMWMTSTCSLEV